MMFLTEEQIKQAAANCDGTDHCACQRVRYLNEDGECYHKACEGPQTECGVPTGFYGPSY